MQLILIFGKKSEENFALSIISRLCCQLFGQEIHYFSSDLKLTDPFKYLSSGNYVELFAFLSSRTV